MAKSRLDLNLLAKLSKKINKRTKYIREQISKRASKKGVSSEAYFVYWLKTENISSAVYQRLLPANIRSEIRDLLSTRAVPSRVPTREQKVQLAKRIFHIGKLKIKPKPTLIPSNFIANAQNNAEVYPILYLFENSVRLFVQKVLEKKHGNNWWKTKIKKEIKDKVAQRKQSEKMNRWHGARGKHEIHYTDFSELSKIVKNHAGDFNYYFRGIKGKTHWLTQKLDELALSRHNIAHVCPLGRRDQERFLLYFTDWYEQLDNLNKLII